VKFYEITDADLRRFYRGSLADAHAKAKCHRPYDCVRIEIVELAADKAAIEALLLALFEPDTHPNAFPNPIHRTGQGYYLSDRGGLSALRSLPKEDLT